jgi:hypothetical protein
MKEVEGDRERDVYEATKLCEFLSCRRPEINDHSWISKLDDIFKDKQSKVSVYCFWGAEGNQGSGSLSLDDIVSSIAALIQLKCGSNASLSPKDFIRTNSVKEAIDWLDASKQGPGIKVCYIKKATMPSDEHPPFDKVALAAKLPVIVINDIYKGNPLGEFPGGFKDFFGQLKVYNNKECKTFSGGLFFDEEIQDQLKAWKAFCGAGMAWLFAIHQGNVYMILKEG